MTSRPLGDEHGWDCSVPLTGEMVQHIVAERWQGNALTFCWRYVFFGPPVHGDLTELETSAITEQGVTLLVVQHVRNPGWTASGQLGAADGAWAVRNALAAGYERGGCLALDLEGLANSGEPVADHATQWCERVRDGGFEPVIYVGYDCGLTPIELYDLHPVARYWSDAGPRSVATRSFCCKQTLETTIAGVRVDVDHAFPDLLGGCLVGMTA